MEKVTDGFGKQSPDQGYTTAPVEKIQFTVTLWRYQPLQSAGAGEHSYVSTWACADAGTTDELTISSAVHAARAARVVRGRLRMGEYVGPPWRTEVPRP